MCDWCGAPADHDKPYEWGRADLQLLRLVPAEVQALTLLRQHVDRALEGCPSGPASGDVQAEPS